MALENEGAEGATGSAADLLGGGAQGGGNGDQGAGAGTGGANGGAGGQGEGGGEGGGSAPDWYANLSSDQFNEGASHRDYVAAKNWKSLDDVVKSYREAEHSLRNGGKIAIPGENASAEEVAAYRRAIGVPEDASGYAIEAPTGPDGKPIPLKADLVERLAGKALDAGMPAGAYKAVMGELLKAQVEELSGLNSERQAEAEKWARDQGAARDEKLNAITKAAEILGFNRDDLIIMRNGIGAEKLMNALSKIGLGLREDTLLGEGRQTFGMSGREAEGELKTLKANPAWVEKALIPGTPENIQYNRLLKMAGDAADREAFAA